MRTVGSVWHRIEDSGGRAACKEGLRACTEERQRKERGQRSGFPATVCPSALAASSLVCNTCSRAFRRKQDITRHKCQTMRPRKSTRPDPASAV